MWDLSTGLWTGFARTDLNNWPGAPGEYEKRQQMKICCRFCREEATRTPDPYVPNVVRYQLRYFSILKKLPLNWQLFRQL